FRKWSNLWSKHFVGVFLKRVTSEKVSVFKGFQRFRKLTAGNRLRAPKPGALPTALHPGVMRAPYYSRFFACCQGQGGKISRSVA
ncbi:MAG: hypothetical protein IIU88_03660, partial [Clostridia bacterium]|nr:hypothetical protein [Clostridia bacterium]